LKNISNQTDNNAKICAIFNTIFEEEFLNDCVLWGQPPEKKTSDIDISSIKIILKTHDVFVDLIRDVLDLQNNRSDTILSNLCRNFMNNKREAKKKENNK